MMSQLDELFQFLEPSGRDDLKFFALTHLSGMTDTDDGKQVFVDNTRFIESVILLTNDKADKIQTLSYTTLINLSADDKLARQITSLKRDNDFIEHLILRILDRDYYLADQACMLLANLTRPRECAKHLADIMAKYDACDRDIIAEIVSIFCTGESFNKHSQYHHLAYILSNLSQLMEISDRLLKSGGLLKKLLPFIGYQESATRRRGVSSIVRNCCLNTEYHTLLLGPDIDVLPALLLPLAGPEEFDEDDNEKLPVDLQYLEPSKAREPDAGIRRLLVESVNQLCATKDGRQYIKDKNAYVIFRELHKWEEDRQTLLAILNVVDILIGDEPTEYDNLKVVDIPHDLKEQFDKCDEDFLKD